MVGGWVGGGRKIVQNFCTLFFKIDNCNHGYIMIIRERTMVSVIDSKQRTI